MIFWVQFLDGQRENLRRGRIPNDVLFAVLSWRRTTERLGARECAWSAVRIGQRM